MLWQRGLFHFFGFLFLISYLNILSPAYYTKECPIPDNINVTLDIKEALEGCEFIIMAIPTSIIWIVSQKFIVNKMTVGGLKG